MVVSHESTRTGAPVVAGDVASSLRARGWRVDLLVRWPGPLDDELRAKADGWHIEPMRHLRLALRRVGRPRGWADRFDEWLAGRALDRLAPDLVWCNTVLSANYVRPARRRGIPVVLHVHELGRLVPGVLRRYAPGTWRLGDPDAGITLAACAPDARDQLAEALAVPPDDVRLLESMIDVDAVVRRGAVARRSSDGLVVGACGHATERKGIDLWLEVARRVHDQRPGTRFVWIGRDGPDHRQTARELGLAEVVDLPGEQPDAVPAIAGFDVFTLPSRYDTFPLVVLEAMALERPCVVFDAGGAVDQLGDTGVVVPSGDLDAFAAAVVDLLDDPRRRARLGHQAHARVRANFDHARFVDLVDDIAAGAALPPVG
jgi:glycosyltransferase involved in cell wall biosynthesis